MADKPNKGRHLGSLDRDRLTVIVVDDNADAAHSLALYLSVSGFNVHSFTDPREALASFETIQPDAAILDIGMPHLSGYELASRFRDLKAMCAVIAVSGWGTADDKERARQFGFDQHLTKPAAAEEVVAAISGLCGEGGTKVNPPATS